MKVSDVTRANLQFRFHRKAISLSASISRRLAYYTKTMPERLSPAHTATAHAYLYLLDCWKNQTNSRLDIIVLIQHTLRRPVADLMAEVFFGLPGPGTAQLSQLEQTLVDLMNTAGRAQRANQQKALVCFETAYRHRMGWFVLFNTLTVDAQNYTKVFRKGSKQFATYIRKVDRLIAQSAYGSIRNAKGHTYHTYFAAVEEGGEFGRLHIHVLHFMSALPRGSRDPNAGLTRPRYQELSLFKRLWTAGTSTPLMGRSSPADAWGKAGYRWPLDKKTGKPREIKSPIALAAYVSKYINKGYSTQKRSELLWRVRKTQNLGKPLLRELLSTLTPEALLATATCPSLNIKINNQLIPPNLLRLSALQSFQNSQSIENPSNMLYEMATTLSPLPSPLHALRGSTQTGPTFNPRNSISTLTTATAETVTSDQFNDAWAQLKDAAQRINRKYFSRSRYGNGSGDTRNIISPKDRAAA